MHFRLEALDQNALELFEDCAKSLERFGKTELIAGDEEHSPRSSPDGYLTVIAPSGESCLYVCEAKRRIDINALGRVTDLLQCRAAKSGRKPLLITSHVTDSVGERLRDAKIAYLDAAGNAFVVTAPPLVYIWVQGFKPAKQPERVSRAFQTTGLQLIALLLSRSNGVEQTYRELAEQAGLSLGSTSRILSDLRSLGFIRLVASGQNALVNSRSLLEHWEFGYATRLRPRLKPQAFRQADRLPMEELPERIPKAMKDEVLIGGELAAAIITRHIRPQTATFHLRAQRPLLPIIKEMRLIPDRAGNIILLEQFGEMSAWRWKNDERECLINPLLVYAELLHGTPDDRLRETAKLIHDQYLTPILTNEPSTLRQ